LIALASLIVFPEVSDLAAAFPGLAADKLGDDAAYPAMLTLLPPGLLGLVAASLLAAFMSTMSTQLNLGASYIVHDFWGRFIRPEASERARVRAGQVATAISLVLGAGLGLMLRDAGQAFQLLLLIGAGTGGLFILRWFWWRISAVTELVAMGGSLVVAAYFTFVHDAVGGVAMEDWQKLVLGAGLTTTIWLTAAFFSRGESEEVLRGFVAKVRPGGPGWKRFSDEANSADGDTSWGVPRQVLGAFIGCIGVYSALMGTGLLLYGQSLEGGLLWGLAGLSVAGILRIRP
jgi:Na+/proline symporter